MIDGLVRANVRDLVPYTSARHLHQDGLFMDANENPFGSVVELPLDVALNRYPDPYSKRLKKALAKYLKTGEERLFVGVGSDEVIDLLIRTFVSPGEEVLTLEPTYGMYRVAAEISGVRAKSCLLSSSFQLDFEALGNAITPKTKIIFCCSPNNPTGNLLRLEDVKRLCKMFRGIVVLDEAYVEFASKPSMIILVKRSPNLVVLRTFSKAWGLAALRVGYAVTNPKTVDYLNKIKPPYNMNAVSAELARKALSRENKLLAWRSQILKERQKLSAFMEKLGFTVYPSEANFVLVRKEGAQDLFKKLASRFEIILRDMSKKPRLADCLRITVGTPQENKRLMKAMEAVL